MKENTLKLNFNSEDINKLREAIERATIELTYIESYNKLTYDKLEEVQQDEVIDRTTRKELNDLDKLAIYKFKVQHNIRDYINLNFSISEKLDAVTKTLDEVVTFMFDAEKSLKQIEEPLGSVKNEPNADNIQ